MTEQIIARAFPNGRVPYRCRVCGKAYEEQACYVVGFADEGGVFLGYCDPCARRGGVPAEGHGPSLGRKSYTNVP